MKYLGVLLDSSLRRALECSRDARLGGGYRTLDQIQDRGRWKVYSSICRYGKAYVYNPVLISIPEYIFQYGQPELAKRGRRPDTAKE